MKKEIIDFLYRNKIENSFNKIYDVLKNFIKYNLELFDDELFIIIKILINDVDTIKYYLELQKMLIKAFILNNDNLKNKINISIELINNKEKIENNNKKFFCKIMLNPIIRNRINKKINVAKYMVDKLNTLINNIQTEFNNGKWCDIYESIIEFNKCFQYFSYIVFKYEDLKSIVNQFKKEK